MKDETDDRIDEALNSYNGLNRRLVMAALVKLGVSRGEAHSMLYEIDCDERERADAMEADSL